MEILELIVNIVILIVCIAFVLCLFIDSEWVLAFSAIIVILFVVCVFLFEFFKDDTKNN